MTYYKVNIHFIPKSSASVLPSNITYRFQNNDYCFVFYNENINCLFSIDGLEYINNENLCNSMLRMNMCATAHYMLNK